MVKLFKEFAELLTLLKTNSQDLICLLKSYTPLMIQNFIFVQIITASLWVFGALVVIILTVCWLVYLKRHHVEIPGVMWYALVQGGVLAASFIVLFINLRELIQIYFFPKMYVAKALLTLMG